jgi:flagellin-like hook-associated protein FlgL
MISINVNPAASGAGLNLGKANEALQKSLSRLSSGQRIVTSSDDAGGLAVSMKMAAALKRTEATAINLRNMVSFLDTQDGAFKVADKVLSRMSELSALSRDVSKNAGDVENYDKEFGNLKLQLASLATEKFNGVSLFDSNSTGARFTVPTSEDGSQSTTVTKAALASDPMMNMMINGFKSWEVGSRKFIAPITAITYNGVSYGGGANPVNAFEVPGGVLSGVSLNTTTGAVTPLTGSQAAVGAAGTVTSNGNQTSLNIANSDEYAFLSQEALQQAADMRAQNGAEMSRINFAQDLLDINAVNLEAANSRIMDVNVAAESSQLARFQILQQAGTAMLAQANTSQQSLVRLLQG